ncbi:tRNA-dihydrouridine synthase, putative [Babesia caballi]|uniref:tRNA-dihydrouridine(16/17) synthase [NAD(P)(+)] n=1 Tax=Babesia caballi TaxID=5871 RepID=A0AAV4M2B0_BABCB|nr:tRNA-dihydrouridine synthase, putative [Babesia caballi]
MLHGRIFAENDKYRAQHFQTAPEDTPLIAQLCGDDAAVLARAAAQLKGKVAAVDLNLGCPQGIAKDGHYGSFLLDEPDLVTGIVSRITQEVGIPVTCKIRKVDKDSLQSTLNFCYGLEQSGCKALTVHGRHRSEKGTNVREADWDAIRIVKSRVRIPGMPASPAAQPQQLSQTVASKPSRMSAGASSTRGRSPVTSPTCTRADAVMSSEAILEKPYLFSGRTYDHLDIMQEYLALVRQHPNHPPCCVRAHGFKLLYQHCQRHHDIRDQLSAALSLDDFEQVLSNLRAAMDPALCYTHASGSWYRRHRNQVDSTPKPMPTADYETSVVDEIAGLFGG